MIQRIQSIWLFLATVAIFGLFLFPFMQFIDGTGTVNLIKVNGLYQQTADQSRQVQSFIPLTIGAVVVALIPFLIIFRYRNRRSQAMFGYLAIVAIIGLSFWMMQQSKQFIQGFKPTMENYGVGTFLPSLAILFIIFAIRSINRDEKLVQSANRLR